MKCELWYIGKTQDNYLETGVAIYTKRLTHYISFDIQCIPDVRQAGKMEAATLKIKEGELVLGKLRPDDFLVLLDEQGQRFSSRGFARWLEQQMLRSAKRLVFLIGGAFGFSDPVYQRANARISLSDMTFSHQMVRLFFVEQLYRGMTIIRNESYHND